jgi:hypothetical protein
MTYSKTLMLAAAAALSLGVGTAMAQDGDTFYDAPPAGSPAYKPSYPVTVQPQAGSSDVITRSEVTMRSGYDKGAANEILYGASGTGG